MPLLCRERDDDVQLRRYLLHYIERIRQIYSSSSTCNSTVTRLSFQAESGCALSTDLSNEEEQLALALSGAVSSGQAPALQLSPSVCPSVSLAVISLMLSSRCIAAQSAGRLATALQIAHAVLRTSSSDERRERSLCHRS